MKFVLFRHAQKGIMPFEDPELSPNGFEQAGQVLQLIKNQTLPTPTQLFVSPKRRTSQSFYPSARELNLTPVVSEDLDQRRYDENTMAFRARVQKFLNQIENINQSDSVCFACTHYDWIEEAMTLINCDRDLNHFEFSHWSPSQFIIFEINDHVWKFTKKGDAK